MTASSVRACAVGLYTRMAVTPVAAAAVGGVAWHAAHRRPQGHVVGPRAVGVQPVVRHYPAVVVLRQHQLPPSLGEACRGVLLAAEHVAQ